MLRSTALRWTNALALFLLATAGVWLVLAPAGLKFMFLGFLASGILSWRGPE